MSKSKTNVKERRGFLKNLAVAGGAATAASVAGRVAASVEEPDAQPEKARTRGYKETAHVREYYRLARF